MCARGALGEADQCGCLGAAEAESSQGFGFASLISSGRGNAYAVGTSPPGQSLEERRKPREFEAGAKEGSIGPPLRRGVFNESQAPWSPGMTSVSDSCHTGLSDAVSTLKP